jgi:hypothetical protein
MPHLTVCRALGFSMKFSFHVLSTPLIIPFRLSRVQHMRLKRDDLGGAFTLSPMATLCGSSVCVEGMSRFTSTVLTLYGLRYSADPTCNGGAIAFSLLTHT